MGAGEGPTSTLRYDEKPVYTTSNGCPIMDPEASQRVGQNGPLLLQDFHLIDLLAHFDRERIPERVVHAKGAGAYGEFEITHDISDLVCSVIKMSRAPKSLIRLRLRWICSTAWARRPSALLASRRLAVRRVHRIRRGILEGSRSSSIRKRAIGIGSSTIPPSSSFVILPNSPSSFIPRSAILRPISRMWVVFILSDVPALP